MERIGQFENSRHTGAPVRLFLFDGTNFSLESMMRSVTIIPGATEFGYGTTAVRKGTGESLNSVARLGKTDFAAAIDELLATAEGLRHVSLVVAWQGSDLRAGQCLVQPKVREKGYSTVPYSWNVGGLERANASAVSIDNNGAFANDGAPSDRTVYEAIRHLRNRNLRVTLHPIVMLDIPPDSGLPDPHGGFEQGAYPWRGLITCHPAPGRDGTPDGTATVTSQIDSFFGNATVSQFGWNDAEKRVTSAASDWRYRRFVLHMATIAKAADATAFLLGSELVGITQVRGVGSAFPGVAKLSELANSVRSIVGPEMEISYGADWSEYHSRRWDGNVSFNMDQLWSNPNVDFIGINNFMPTSDWRDGNTHADRVAGYTSIYDLKYHQDNIEGGEFYDWRYAGDQPRAMQSRSPIVDNAHDKPWVFRQKDIRNWWRNPHFNRIDGVESANPTSWVPQSKQIVFTALGCPAVDKGSNQPSLSGVSRISRNGTPPYSANRPDAAVQRIALEAQLRYWVERNPVSTGYGGRMIRTNETSLWTWDARPFPDFPDEVDRWHDAIRWSKGYWLTGRVFPGRAFNGGDLGVMAFCDGEKPITRAGITYQPWPIKHSAISTSGSLDKSDLKITLALGTDLDDLFIAFPPSQVLNVTIFEGHMGSEPTRSNFPAKWIGRMVGATYETNELTADCAPVSSMLRRPGLRRAYQVGCPHVLYGEQCRAIKRAATYTRAVAAIGPNRVTLDDDITLGVNQQIAGGIIEWTDPETGRSEVRTIARKNGLILVIRGTLRGLAPGVSVKISRGCNHRMSGCNAFGNILNYGGQPFIPRDNPLSSKSQFY